MIGDAGIALVNRGQTQLGLKYLHKAIRMNPRYPAFHESLRVPYRLESRKTSGAPANQLIAKARYHYEKTEELGFVDLRRLEKEERR